MPQFLCNFLRASRTHSHAVAIGDYAVASAITETLKRDLLYPQSTPLAKREKRSCEESVTFIDGYHGAPTSFARFLFKHKLSVVCGGYRMICEYLIPRLDETSFPLTRNLTDFSLHKKITILLKFC